MQSPIPISPLGWRALCARLGAGIAGLPLGGFAAPPPTLFASMHPGPDGSPTRRAPSGPEPAPAIRWTTLSAVR